MEQFVERMANHIAVEFPTRYEEMGHAGTRQFISEALEIGRQHQVVSRGAVAVLIELMLDFGRDFERSPDRAWAKTVMDHPTLPDGAKMGAIRDRMMTRTGGRRILPFRRHSPDAG
jgi:hypothetical protein